MGEWIRLVLDFQNRAMLICIGNSPNRPNCKSRATMTLSHPELWRLDCYNLICFGPGAPRNEEIFHKQSGNRVSFPLERVFEDTSPPLKDHYVRDPRGLVQLPTLVVKEFYSDPPLPARFSRLSNLSVEGNVVVFDYHHISDFLTSQEVYNEVVPYENARTHWAVKEGNLLEKLTALWYKRAIGERPKIFGLDEWPLVKREHIAVMMPYAHAFDPVYEAIKGACAKVRCSPLRVDEIYGTNWVVKDIFTTIDTGRLVICDITGRNPNVLYEVGIAHARNVEVVLITQNDDDVPFDLRHIRYVRYSTDVAGLEKLEFDLVQTIESALRTA